MVLRQCLRAGGTIQQAHSPEPLDIPDVDLAWRRPDSRLDLPQMARALPSGTDTSIQPLPSLPVTPCWLCCGHRAVLDPKNSLPLPLTGVAPREVLDPLLTSTSRKTWTNTHTTQKGVLSLQLATSNMG